MLVYEFMSNGTLRDHLSGMNVFPCPWNLISFYLF